MNAPLPYGRQTIDDDDVAAVTAVLRSDWLTTGPAVDAFERSLAARVGARHAVACANGTAALHLAALALDIKPGDICIVPTMTFLATANAVRYVGGEVAFADVNPATGLVEVQHLDAAAKRAGGPIKAVFPVHLNGQTADMPAIGAWARQRGAAIVEDACHALGTVTSGAPSGACRDSQMAVFSFHPVKTATMGEGGAITTNDADLDARLRLFRNHGMTRDPLSFSDADAACTDGQVNPWHYEMHAPGYNYRASDVQCALGSSQLAKLDRFIDRRRRLARRYDEILAPHAPTVRTIARMQGCDAAWHLYVALVDYAAAGTTRRDVMLKLKQDGIFTQVHYWPVHHQPYYRSRYGAIDLPGADAYYARCLSLPLFPTMTELDVERVVASLAAALS